MKPVVRINKISITGGEPTLDLDKLTDYICFCKSYFPDVFTILNTNGKLDSIKLEKFFQNVVR